jgi:adenine deaminase
VQAAAGAARPLPGAGRDPIEAEAAGRERAAAVAMGESPATVLLEGGRVVDVYSGRIIRADVALAGDRIAFVGDASHAVAAETERVDCRGHFVLPGFVEPHLHVGGSQLTIERLAEVLVTHGTVALSTCFYEAAIVVGLDAVESLIERAEGTGLDVLFSPFLVAMGQGARGGRAAAADLLGLVRHPRTVEIREWSHNIAAIPGMRELWVEALRRNLQIGGHLEGLDRRGIDASVAIACCSDHEVVSAAEAIEKVRAGVSVQIRDGSGARDLRNVLPAITEHGLDPACFAFSTDGQELDTLAADGHLDARIRLAVKEGLAPVDAVRMATLGAARGLGVERNYGAVAPGRVASLVVVDDLAGFGIDLVFSRGLLAARRGEYLLEPERDDYPEAWRDTVHVRAPLGAADFALAAESGRMRVIGVTPGSLLTAELVESVTVEGGRIAAGPGLAKIALIDRHQASGRIAVAPIRGLDLSGGAVASTYEPGTANLMVVGDDEEAMALVANRVIELGGGIATASNGKIRAEVALPVFGILSDRPSAEVVVAIEAIARSLRRDLGCPHPGILTNAGFACLASAIPALKLSDRGLVRVEREASPQPVPLAVGGAEGAGG